MVRTCLVFLQKSISATLRIGRPSSTNTKLQLLQLKLPLLLLSTMYSNAVQFPLAECSRAQALAHAIHDEPTLPPFSPFHVNRTPPPCSSPFQNSTFPCLSKRLACVKRTSVSRFAKENHLISRLATIHTSPFLCRCC